MTAAGGYRAPGRAMRPTPAAVISAFVLAGATFSVLPFFGMLSARSHETVRLRPAPEVTPPPAPPARAPASTFDEPSADRPRPRLESELPAPRRKHVEALRAEVPLALGSLKTGVGDFSLDFALAPGAGLPEAGGLEDLLFGLADLNAPPRAIAAAKPVYPAGAKRRGIEGFVEILFTITPQGRVEDIEVIASEPGDTFVAATRTAVGRWRFSPPRRNDKAVSVRVSQMVRFQLEED